MTSAFLLSFSFRSDICLETTSLTLVSRDMRDTAHCFFNLSTSLFSCSIQLLLGYLFLPPQTLNFSTCSTVGKESMIFPAASNFCYFFSFCIYRLFQVGKFFYPSLQNKPYNNSISLS